MAFDDFDSQVQCEEFFHQDSQEIMELLHDPVANQFMKLRDAVGKVASPKLAKPLPQPRQLQFFP
jgi:ATP-dependent DNA ligase